MDTKKKNISNYDYFIRANTSSCKGEWIAIAQGKVVAHGNDAEKVYKAAQKKVPRKDISLAKAPDEQMLILNQECTAAAWENGCI